MSIDRLTTAGTLEKERQVVKRNAPGDRGATILTSTATLDFATWRARLAAPGSRFQTGRPAAIVRLDTVSRAAFASETERQTA
jgi:hypothetical protein